MSKMIDLQLVKEGKFNFVALVGKTTKIKYFVKNTKHFLVIASQLRTCCFFLFQVNYALCFGLLAGQKKIRCHLVVYKIAFCISIFVTSD